VGQLPAVAPLKLYLAKDVTATGQPVGVTGKFVTQDPRIVQFVDWPERPIAPGTVVSFNWSVRGAQIGEGRAFPRPGDGGVYFARNAPQGGWPAGPVDVVVSLNGAPAAIGQFTIDSQLRLTEDRLRAAMLTVQDLGPAGAGFGVAETGPLKTRAVNSSSTLVRKSAGQETTGVVSVGLTDANAEPPVVTARDYVAELTDNGRSGQSWTVAAPAIGRDAVRYELVFWTDGRTWYGNAIAWRHGDVTAIVAMVSGRPAEPAAATLGLAQRQQQKLAAAFR
jgi:hypothetical protein